MGASEDRATLAEHERQRRASEVEEIMVPGHGIWTKESLKTMLDLETKSPLDRVAVWREMGLL